MVPLLVPLLVSVLVVVWALAVASMMLWWVRKRQKPSTHASSSVTPAAQDNNALHNRISTAREQLNHIRNPIEKNPPNWHHYLYQDKNSVNTTIQKSDTGVQLDEDEVDRRLQRFPRAPPAYSDWEARPPHRTSKQDNRELQSQGANRVEFIV